MGITTKIEWTDRTWSPVRARVKPDALDIAKAKGYTSLVRILERRKANGDLAIIPGRSVGPHCEHVSPGCENCYSGTNNTRCLPSNGTGLPFDRRSRDLIETFVDEKALLLPLKWKQPRKIFLENQADLFGEWVPDEAIDRVFAVMALSPRHTFQCLTKRSGRMLKYFARLQHMADEWAPHTARKEFSPSDVLNFRHMQATFGRGPAFPYHPWPLPNVWLGVSAEDQQRADERIPDLLATPAAARCVSYEPALGPVDWDQFPLGTMNGGENPGIDWVIVGGESGPGARPFDVQWARNTVRQCREAGVACFLKQLGAHPQEIAYPNAVTDSEAAKWQSDGWTRIVEQDGEHWRKYIRLEDRKGGEMAEWPNDVPRVREFPEGATQ